MKKVLIFLLILISSGLYAQTVRIFAKEGYLNYIKTGDSLGVSVRLSELKRIEAMTNGIILITHNSGEMREFYYNIRNEGGTAYGASRVTVRDALRAATGVGQTSNGSITVTSSALPTGAFQDATYTASSIYSTVDYSNTTVTINANTRKMVSVMPTPGSTYTIKTGSDATTGSKSDYWQVGDGRGLMNFAVVITITGTCAITQKQ